MNAVLKFSPPACLKDSDRDRSAVMHKFLQKIMPKMAQATSMWRIHNKKI